MAIIVILLLIAGAVWLVMRDREAAQQANNNTNSDQTNSDILDVGSTVPVVTQNAEYTPTVTGFLAKPEQAGTYPGVVMIHEWWGLNQQIKDMAVQLAKQGYIVLAVDLYNGQVAGTPEQAMQYSGGVRDNQQAAITNLEQAVSYLKDQGASKVASLGWCFGGGQSLQLSLAEPLDATVIYYGSLVTDRQQLANIKWPVLGVFGEDDTSIPISQVEQFATELDTLGVENIIYVYPGVGHAFANPSAQTYSAEATKDAWAKTVMFLDQHLKGAESSAAIKGLLSKK